MNPRESLMGELFDEFSQDLAAPVELSHTPTHSQSLLYSQHNSRHNPNLSSSSHHFTPGSSTANASSSAKKGEGSPRSNNTLNPNFNLSSSSSSHSSSGTTHIAVPSAALHQLTRTESEQLARFLQLLKAQFANYRSSSSASNAASGSMAASAEELRTCYREVS